MPSGRTHLNVNMALGIVVVPIVCLWVAPTNEIAVSFSAGYIVGSLFMSPDLDVDFYSINQWNVKKYFGGIVGKLYAWYWYPYARLFKHRGISHWVGLGTITRLAYASIPLIVLYFLGLRIPLDLYLAFSVGMEFSSLFHIIADRIL